jgi:hypothetical protein
MGILSTCSKCQDWRLGRCKSRGQAALKYENQVSLYTTHIVVHEVERGRINLTAFSASSHSCCRVGVIRFIRIISMVDGTGVFEDRDVHLEIFIGREIQDAVDNTLSYELMQ